MAISPEEVKHVALLSRLELTEDEVAHYSGQLTKIFAYVEELNAVDVTDVPPTAHPLPIHDVLRADASRPSLTNEEALSNAPEREDHCFKVPQIV